MTTDSKRAFTFGRNWQRFLRSYTPERQQNAQNALLSFLQLPDLKGKTFLDIGCGSGIHSAAAWRAGAARIHSFDYDPNSVAATRQLHQHHGSPANWVIEHGSALDAAYVKQLGTFDVVYSWGVLHHTGDQWQALRNALQAMHAQSRVYIALYAKETQYPHWQHWVEVKQRYNRASWAEKRWMEIKYVWEIILGKDWKKIVTLPRIMSQYHHARGMHFMTDVRDWLGGWPTEFSSVPEVADFVAREFGLALVGLRTGEANSEFLLVKKEQVSDLGLSEVDLLEHQFGLPVLEDTRRLPDQPVWIFGTARGGDLMFDYLTQNKIPVAGFIDVGATTKTLHGRPVLEIEDFMNQQPLNSTVVLANRYFKENAARLRPKGFTVLFNAHPLVLGLHYNKPVQTAA